MSAIGVRRPAPKFVANALLPDESFGKVSLESLTANGAYAVIFFYPLDFTFVCPTEIIQFSDAAERFKALNVNVAAASIDSLHTHLAWVQTPRSRGGLGKMNVPIISDVTKALSKSFGFLVEDAADDEAGVACRGTVIIGPNGVVRHISCNDLPVGRDVEEVLRLVAAFQYVDKHGEVCPAGWKAGAKAPALKADPKESKAYFAEVYKN